MKIFKVGFDKAGTASLHQALKQLGYRSMHQYQREEEILKQLILGKRHSDLKQFDAFVDGNWGQHIEAILEHFPEAFLIFTIRDREKWIQSRIINALSNRYFQKPGLTEINTIQWGEMYDQHLQSVRQKLTSHTRYLEINIPNGEGWEKLCPFLKVAVPENPFPRINTGENHLENILRAKQR
ncbi:MAG TPA: hypothetical protein DD473_20705 [Planctomycetaceae bacterium]|nr:hypothetical protein [Planctomycetaceae bacterium]|tara:strand:+ start:556 stop:1101 length:546 start_codon:yes stop_codon:yes gene_type:complete